MCAAPIAPVRRHGLHFNYGGRAHDVKSVNIIIIHAAFGDATLLEVTDDADTKRHYLVDGGPTTLPGQNAPVKSFQNIVEIFLKDAFKVAGQNIIKADAMMVTHPDGDHIQGIISIFQHFPPNQDPEPGKAKLEFPGPLLLTEIFESYPNYMKAFTDAHFEKDNLFVPGKPLNAFERQFDLFYPVDVYPGTMYNYKDPAAAGGGAGGGGGAGAGGGGGAPPVPRAGYGRYSPDSSPTNASSILLVIKDPADPVNNAPWVSLNGDGLGHHALQSLNNQHPKVFKVPHHGSVHNSIPLGEFVPDEALLTAKLIVTEILLNKAINDALEIKEVILDKLQAEYQKIISATPPGTRAQDALAPELSFADLMKAIAKDFDDELKNYATPVNTANLLAVLQARTNTIKGNIRNISSIDDIKTDVYTKGVAALPADFNNNKYLAVKRNIIAKAEADKVKRKKEGYEKVFKILEKDFTFAEDLAFFMIRAFYNKVKANTYFISAGHAHDHPTWEIVSGIIAAAHDARAANPAYKCRLLLTSGNNIKGKKLEELYKVDAGGVPDPNNILTNDWTQYMKLQYFAGDSAAVYLDPNEVDPNVILPGTVQWNRATTRAQLNALKRKYRDTEGAVALRKKRAVASNKYEIKPYGQANHWLQLVPPAIAGGDVTFTISIGTAIGIKVQTVGVAEKEKSPHTGVYIQIELDQTNPAAAKVEAFAKNAENPIDYSVHFIFIMTGPLKDTRKYFKCDAAGVFSLVDKSKDATYFKFDKTAVPRIAARITSESRDSYNYVETVRGGGSGTVVVVVPEEPGPGEPTPPEPTPPTFSQYLQSLSITENVSTFNMYDAVILLLQSDLNGYFVVNSLAQVFIGKILQWSINDENSSVETISFPTGPIVKKANIVAQIPGNDASMNFHLSHNLTLNKIEIVYPELSPNQIYLSGTATVGEVAVNIKCLMPEPEELPEIEISLAGNVTLDKVIEVLQISSIDMSAFNVPLMTALRDIVITEAAISFKQGIQSSQSVYISKLALGVSFTNLSSYLPSSFSSLSSIDTHVVIYQPKIPPIKIALEIDFNFEIQVSQDKTVPLTASFATRPVNTDGGSQSSYDITVLVQAGSTVIGTGEGGINIADFLGAFGLGAAVTAAEGIPFISSLLQKVQLKRLLLGMNSGSKSITSFILELCIFEWNLIPNKVAIDQADLYMYYDNSKWKAGFKSTATFGGQYPVDISFELSNSDLPVKFTFENYNDELTIAKFFEIFGLGNMGDLPIVGQFLSIAVTEASLDISKTDSGIRVSRGKISLHAESIDIGSILQLSQVNATIGTVYNSDQSSYVFSFSISGFINDKLYVSVTYDPNTSILYGQLSVSTFKQATIADVILSLIKSTESVENNAAYTEVSQSPSASVEFKLKLESGSFRLNDLIIDMNKVITIGFITLERLKFEYHYIEADSNAGTPVRQLYTLMGILTDSQKASIGAVLEFDLEKNSTGKNVVSASIRPTVENALTIRKFLDLIHVEHLPALPQIEGQSLPGFFDIGITQGSITLSTLSYEIEAFSIHVETTNEVTIFESPLIKLKKLSLKVDYNKDATPIRTTAFLKGIFTIGGIDLTLQGSREANGDTVFRLLATTEEDSDSTADLQQSIGTLTPTGTTSPVVPSNIGIPMPLNVLMAELVVKFSPSNNENSVLLTGTTHLDWPIDLGFQQFTVKQVGGKISYKKSTITQSPPPPQYDVYITGQFKYADNILMSSELHFGGQNVDTVLSVLVSDANQIQIATVTDHLLGFHDPQDSNSKEFNDLLPEHTRTIESTKAFININFTKKIFGLFGEIRYLGSASLIAGDFSTTSTANYGYVFSISLPDGFKFSNLLTSLSAIDDILTVRKANCMVVYINNVKVSEVVTKIKSVQQTAVTSENVKVPFSNITLDSFTNDQNLVPGLSIYCELDFTVFDTGSLFNSIIQISNESSVPSVILSSLISTDPSQSVFKAYISNLTLLGAFQFTDVTLIYRPSSETSFELNGKVSITLGDSSFDFIGQFTCSSTQSVFSVSTGNEQTIAAPLGMSGITLKSVQLSLTYNYPNGQRHTSSQSLSGTVNFYSDSSQVSSSSATPSVVLTGSVIFHNYSPTVVKLVLETDKPLTIADLVATVFTSGYNKLYFLNIGFVSGHVYYARLGENEPTIEIDGVTYKKGYHIAADIEIFDKEFTIQADILPDTREVSVRGYAKGAIDLGFAKFTGVSESNASQPDAAKSPEVVFSYSPSVISISLQVGFILFDFPVGVGQIGFKKEDDIKKFYGNLTYSGDIGFLKNPSIGFEWSKENGFKVTNWPGSGDLSQAFDFFNHLKTYSGGSCGSLVDMIFREGVKSEFDINVGLSKTTDPDQFLAQIDITGSYKVSLAGKVKIASVPLPDISVGIPKEDEFTLQKLPQFILDLFSKNADNIVKQILDNPERLSKIVGLAVFKSISKKVVSSLVCRNVDDDTFDQPDEPGEDDPVDQDLNEAEDAEDLFNENFESFESSLSDGLVDLGEAAGAAAGAEESADGAVGLFAGVIGTFTAILAFFGIGSANKEKNDRAKRKKEEIERKKKEIKRKMEAALDIKGPPTATFTPPNQLSTSWNSVGGSGASYHVIVMGTPVDKNHLGQKTATPIKIHEETTTRTSISLTDDRLYNMVGLKVIVNGTIRSGNYTYNGKTYSLDVLNVHPTLHSPSNIQITYHHSSRQINVTASPVDYAENYYFELVDNNNNPLGHRSYNPPSGSIQIQCSFLHSFILDSSIGPFRVRGKSVARSGSNIATSAYAYSNNLTILPPPTNVNLTIPHFKEQNQTINVTWTLPSTVSGINSFTCQIEDDKSKTVLLTQDFNKATPSSSLPTTGSFQMNDLVNAVTGLNSYTFSDIVILNIKVSSTTASEQNIDSIFGNKSVSSLKSPENVTSQFSSDDNNLQISWTFSQQTTNYGIEIRDASSNIVWSKIETIRLDPDVNNAVSNISLSEITNVNNTNTQYSVQVISVASGNDSFDSFIPNRAPGSLQVLTAPVLTSYKYKKQSDSIATSFQQVTNASKYLVKLRKNNEQAIIFSESLSYQSPVNVSVDKFIDQFINTDNVKCSVQSLGAGALLSSAESTYSNTLSPLAPPTNITYTYNTSTETIVIGGTAAQGIQTYLVAFINSTGDGTGDVKSMITISSSSITHSFSTDQFINSDSHTAKKWKIYIQSTLSGDSTTQLPSPRLFHNQEISILDTPSIQAMEYSSSDGLQITLAADIDNADNYKAHISLIANDESVINEFTKELPTSQGTELIIRLSQEVSNWDSITTSDNFAKIRAKVAAGGSNYYLTSKMSQPLIINRSTAPSNIQYQYSPATDIVTVSFQSTGISLSKKVKVFMSSVEGNQEVSKEVDPSSGQATFTGQEIRDKGQNEWTINAQTSGHLPSKKITHSDNMQVLDTPHITSASYDPSTTRMGFDWNMVQNAASYKITIGYETSDGNKHTTQDTVGPHSLGMTNTMKWVHNWREVSDSSVFTIKIFALAYDNTMYINSNTSEEYSISPKLSFFTTSSETTLYLDWSRVYENRDISIYNGNIQFHKSVQDRQYTAIPKKFFLYPQSNRESIGVRVTVDDQSMDDHYNSTKQVSVEKQNIYDTGILGYDSGTVFDDGLQVSSRNIVGVKRLEINYGESVSRIRATYRVANFGQQMASFHGSYSSNQVTIELDDNEFIIGVTASSSQSTGLSKLIIITQKANGTYLKYGPYGTATPSDSDNIPIKFSGNVISFKGKTSSQGLNGIGFHYAYTSPNLSVSPYFGGAEGGKFDENPLINIAQVSRVQSIKLQYDSKSLVSIQPTYKSTDNTVWQSTKRGGTGYGDVLHQVNIPFEEGEVLIGMSGYTSNDQRVSSVVITQLSLTTQKPNGLIEVYGPYGKSLAHDGTRFIVRGTIYGLFGQNGWIINGLGAYYALERTEIFGGTGGDRFEDIHTPTPIVGIQGLSFRYSSNAINSIEGSYLISDGSTWDSALHGSSSTSFTFKNISFEEGEDIVSMIVGKQRSDSSSSFNIEYIELVTQKKDGTCKQYERIGNKSNANDLNHFETEFKGRIVSFFGQSSSQMVTAIGAQYIHIYPPLTIPIVLPDVKDPRFGGVGGNAFDHKTLIPTNSPVKRVKILMLEHDDLALVTLRPTYEFENGDTYEAPTRGGTGYEGHPKHRVTLNFEDGEIMIGVFGRIDFDGRVPVEPRTDVSKFSVITQKSDGTTKVYGPYGKTSDSGTQFIARGKVTAFYGRSGWLIDQVSVYCSLTRSVIIGGNEGKRFADKHEASVIVGIKSLSITHSHKIHSLQTVYNLSDGTTWTAPARGSDTFGTVDTLTFEEGEDIISIKVNMAGYVVGGLEIKTQKSDGTTKTYPQVGAEGGGRHDGEIKGRVISLIGRSDYNLNGIGAVYIPLS